MDRTEPIVYFSSSPELTTTLVSPMSLWRYAQPSSICSISTGLSELTLAAPTATYPPKTRALFGIGVMAWASIGLWTAPQVESALGLQATKEEQEALDRQLAVRVAQVGPEEKGSRAK